MEKKKTIRVALVSSMATFCLCLIMFVVTTFAMTSNASANEGVFKKIEGGITFDVKKYSSNTLGNVDPWISLENIPDRVIFNSNNWEPGVARYEKLKFVKEKKELSVDYELTFSCNNPGALAEVIQVYILTEQEIGNIKGSFADEIKKQKLVSKGTLADIFRSNKTPLRDVTLGVGVESDIFCIVLYMPESAGNEYQNQSVGTFDIKVVATPTGISTSNK